MGSSASGFAYRSEPRRLAVTSRTSVDRFQTKRPRGWRPLARSAGWIYARVSDERLGAGV